MSHRRHAPKPAKSFSFDLQEDWRPYADPLPAPQGDHNWRYHGTVTVNGVKGALAWRAGWFGIGVGAAPVKELGMWERIAIQNALALKTASGWEDVPQFAPAPSHSTPPQG